MNSTQKLTLHTRPQTTRAQIRRPNEGVDVRKDRKSRTEEEEGEGEVTDDNFHVTTADNRTTTQTDDGLTQAPATGLTNPTDMGNPIEFETNDSQDGTGGLDLMQGKPRGSKMRVHRLSDSLDRRRGRRHKQLIIDINEIERIRRREPRSDVTIDNFTSGGVRNDLRQKMTMC